MTRWKSWAAWTRRNGSLLPAAGIALTPVVAVAVFAMREAPRAFTVDAALGGILSAIIGVVAILTLTYDRRLKVHDDRLFSEMAKAADRPDGFSIAQPLRTFHVCVSGSHATLGIAETRVREELRILPSSELTFHSIEDDEYSLPPDADAYALVVDGVEDLPMPQYFRTLRQEAILLVYVGKAYPHERSQILRGIGRPVLACQPWFTPIDLAARIRDALLSYLVSTVQAEGGSSPPLPRPQRRQVNVMEGARSVPVADGGREIPVDLGNN